MAWGCWAETQKLSLSYSLFLRDDKQGGFGCCSGQSSGPVLASRNSLLTLLLPVLTHCQESFAVTSPHVKTSNISREVTRSLSVQNKICKVPAHSKQPEKSCVQTLKNVLEKFRPGVEFCCESFLGQR